MIKDFVAEFGGCKLSAPEMCGVDELTSPEVFCAERIAVQIKREEKRCDEIVLCDADGATGIFCVENKRGNSENLRSSHVCQQLQGGADIVEKYIGEEETPRFMPVLVLGGEDDLPDSIYRKFRDCVVKLKNLERGVQILKEGENLSLS